MKNKFLKNIDRRGRLIRLGIGLLVLGYAYWTMSWVALLVALFVLFESLMSWCIVYQILGRKSCKINKKR